MKNVIIRGRGIEVYEYIYSHPNTTLKEMRRYFDFDERTLRRWVVRLRENSVVTCHKEYGSARKYYKVLKSRRVYFLEGRWQALEIQKNNGRAGRQV